LDCTGEYVQLDPVETRDQGLNSLGLIAEYTGERLDYVSVACRSVGDENQELYVPHHHHDRHK
jgi:hypothetical protein